MSGPANTLSTDIEARVFSGVYLFVRIITMTVSVLNSLHMGSTTVRCVGGYEATSRDVLALSNAII